MTKHAQKIASLEIKKRHCTLANHIFDLTMTFAHGLIVTKQVKNGWLDDNMNLTQKDLATKMHSMLFGTAQPALSMPSSSPTKTPSPQRSPPTKTLTTTQLKKNVGSG